MFDNSIAYKKSKFNFEQVSSDEGLLLYNSLSRRILKISSGLYAEAKYGFFDTNIVNVSSNLMLAQELINDGFLVEGSCDENLSARLKYLQEVASPQLYLTIVPTYGCNFNCAYCYQNRKNNAVMTEEMQDAIVSFVRKNISRYTSVYLSWFGGEPLLCMDAILKINHEVKKICAERYRWFGSAITTNGYFLRRENFEQLLESGLRYYYITIDGTPSMHDRQRYLLNGGKTQENIVRNLSEIKQIRKTKNFVISIRTNLSKDMFSEIGEYISSMHKDFADDSRFSFSFRPVYDWGGEQINSFRENLVDAKKGNEDVLDLLVESEVGMNYWELVRDLTTSAVCYASKINSYVINPDGSINKCTHDNFGNNIIGRLLPTGEMVLDNDKIGMWASQYSGDENTCMDCFLYGICFSSFCLKPQVMDGLRQKKCSVGRYTYSKILSLIDKYNHKYNYIRTI